jgi:pantothenate kinase type III
MNAREQRPNPRDTLDKGASGVDAVTNQAARLVQMGVMLRCTIFLKNLNDSPKWQVKGYPFILILGRFDRVFPDKCRRSLVVPGLAQLVKRVRPVHG